MRLSRESCIVVIESQQICAAYLHRTTFNPLNIMIMITDYNTAVHWLGNAFILCNNIVENDESVIENIEYPEWTNDNEDGRDGIEIFQWFLTNMSCEDKEWMQKNFPDLIFSYSDKLDLWVLCVDHFGTMWKGVSTTTNCENAAKASQLL